MSKQPPSSRGPDRKFHDNSHGYGKPPQYKPFFPGDQKHREDHKVKPPLYKPKEEVKFKEHDKLSDKFRDLEAPKRIDKHHELDRAKALYKQSDKASVELEKPKMAEKSGDRHKDDSRPTSGHSSRTRSPDRHDRRHGSRERHRRRHSSHRDSRERRDHHRDHRRHGHSHSPSRKRRHSSRSGSRSYSRPRTPPEPAGHPAVPPPPPPPGGAKADPKHSKEAVSQNPTEPPDGTSWKGYPLPRHYRELAKFYDPLPKFNVFIPNLYFPLDGVKLRRYKQYKCYNDRLHKYDKPNYYRNDLLSLMRADYAFFRRKLELMDYQTEFSQLSI